MAPSPNPRRAFIGLVSFSAIGLICNSMYGQNTWDRAYMRQGRSDRLLEDPDGRAPDLNRYLNSSTAPLRTPKPTTTTARGTTKSTPRRTETNTTADGGKGKTAKNLAKKPPAKITEVKKEPPVKATPKKPLQKASKNQTQLINAYLDWHNKTCVRGWENRTLPFKPLCECVPETLKGALGVKLDPRPLNVTESENPEVKGGHWEPSHCAARYRLAVVIPYRDRPRHLGVLLHYLHPMLQGQQLNYTIIVVEQSLPELFNKAALMNVGFEYAMQVQAADCVVFHDVDHIPEDGRHFYWCTSPVVHLGAYHSGHKYKILYNKIFGAVTAFRPDAFRMVNGFSNRFFGWGGEDDDMASRVRNKKYRIERHPRVVAGYRVFEHKRDSRNSAPGAYNINKYILNKNSNHKFDGLNTLRFNVDKVEQTPLYHWLYVELLNDRTNVEQAINKR